MIHLERKEVGMYVTSFFRNFRKAHGIFLEIVWLMSQGLWFPWGRSSKKSIAASMLPTWFRGQLNGSQKKISQPDGIFKTKCPSSVTNTHTHAPVPAKNADYDLVCCSPAYLIVISWILWLCHIWDFCLTTVAGYLILTEVSQIHISFSESNSSTPAVWVIVNIKTRSLHLPKNTTKSYSRKVTNWFCQCKVILHMWWWEFVVLYFSNRITFCLMTILYSL